MRIVRLMLLASVFLGAGAVVVLATRTPWPLLAAAGLAALAGFGKTRQSLFAHGTAAWATAAELERAGLTGGEGLCVGVVHSERPAFVASLWGLFDPGKPAARACADLVFSMRKLQRYQGETEIRLNNSVHTVVIAPTGAGKGVSLVIPFLRECPHSLAAIDPKGENLTLCAAARRAMGHRVVALDPFRTATRTPDTLNPLQFIDVNGPTAPDDCRAVADQMVQRTGTEPDPFWNLGAISMITALIALTLFLDEKDRNLQTVRLLLSDEERREKLLRHMATVTEWGGMLARLCQQALVHRDKQLAGILAAANTHMSFLDTMAVAESTRSSSFDLADLFKGKMSVFLVLPPQYLDSHSGLLRLWIGSIVRACLTNGPQEKHKLFLVLDEAASLGRMDILKHAVDKARGYGLRAIFFFQALSQIKEMYPNGQDSTLLSNVSLIMFGTRDKESAEYVSAVLGKETIIVESTGTNTGTSTSANRQDANGSYGTSRGGNRSYQQHGRELLTPDEVINGLSQRTAITLTAGVRPIVTTLLRYYEKPPGFSRWRRLRVTAEIWLAALSLLALTGTLGWCLATVLLSPKGR
jgi:type IV secretion system protein VirD4